MLTLPIVSFFLGACISLGLIPIVIILAARGSVGRRQTDLHHTHKAPVPRLGGLSLVLAFLFFELFSAIFEPEKWAAIPGRNVILLSSLGMFALGFWDDLRPIGARKKLLGQVLLALIVWFSGIGIERFHLPLTANPINVHAWSAPVTVLWLVGMTNLINLIDGVDGLAGGISLMLMTLLAYIGHQGGHFELVAAGMAGALLGFLRFNFPPARIYLGDGGAYLLGFQIGIFSLVNSHKGTIFAALIAPLFVLALPIVDTCLAILRRGLRGLPIFRPDRRHIHHRMLGMGLSRQEVVLSIYSVTLVFLVIGLLAFWSSGKLIPILLGITFFILLLCAGQLSFSKEWFAVGRVLGNSLEMRQEVQYALALTRWLALEGGRATSIEALWSDLLFVARKLGFTSVKLVLGERAHEWHQVSMGEPLRTVTHQLQGGRFGVLELTVHSPLADATVPLTVPKTETSSENPFPSIADESLFEIVSELLAEGWVKAITDWRTGDPNPVCFEGKVAIPSRALRRSPFLSFFSPQSAVSGAVSSVIKKTE